MTIQHSLFEEQSTFAFWLTKEMPYLLPLFDFQKREFLPVKVNHFLRNASSGEEIMARFVLGVWQHEDKYDFDFIEASRRLDDRSIRIITE